MSVHLSTQKCEVCHKNSLAVTDKELALLLKEIPLWTLVDESGITKLQRVYTFKNYTLAWTFVNKVSELAEKEFHHPSLLLEWGKVTVTWWTHAISGLHKNDLICAAKTDTI